MSEIDTSAAAIERIKALQEQYRPLFEPDDARVAYEFFQNVDTLLAALAERDAKLAAHEACLTQVREEMPEVKELYERRDMQGVLYSHHPCGDSDSSYQICANCRQQWPCDDSLIDKVVDYAVEAQQNAARWRNARDVWEAERKRLQERVEFLEQLSGLRATVIAQKDQQLSASNAACAEMREALELAIKEDWKGQSVPLSVNAKVFHALAAQPKQQSVGIDVSGQTVYELPRMPNHE